MAVSETHVSLLGFVVVSLATYVILVDAHSPIEGVKIEHLHLDSQDARTDNGDSALETRDYSDMSTNSGTVESVPNNVGDGNTTITGNEDGTELSSRSVSGGTRVNEVELKLGTMTLKRGEGVRSTYSDNSMQITSKNSLKLRMLKGNEGVSVKSDQVYEGGRVLCADTKRRTAEPTYQKSAGGARWHANIQVGEPMTQAEINQFEADWAKNEKELQRRAAERRREQNEYMKAFNARAKRELIDRERRLKERLEAANKRRVRRQNSRGGANTPE